MKRHCRTCSCTRELKTFTIYPANSKLYGRCGTCKQAMWEVEYHDEFVGYAPRRSAHCGCCTHAHDLRSGGHDEACLADPPECDLARNYTHTGQDPADRKDD